MKVTGYNKNIRRWYVPFWFKNEEGVPKRVPELDKEEHRMMIRFIKTKIGRRWRY